VAYKILADAVVFAHFLWIVFLIFGVFWGRKNRLVRCVHVAGLLFAITIQVADWYCPLTHLEVWLRAKHTPDLSYKGSFIVYYIEKVVYIDLAPSWIFALTILLSVMTVSVYLKTGNKNKVRQR